MTIPARQCSSRSAWNKLTCFSMKGLAALGWRGPFSCNLMLQQAWPERRLLENHRNFAKLAPCALLTMASGAVFWGGELRISREWQLSCHLQDALAGAAKSHFPPIFGSSPTSSRLGADGNHTRLAEMRCRHSVVHLFPTYPALCMIEPVLERFTSALTLRWFCDARRRLRSEFSRASSRSPIRLRWAARLTH